MKNLAQEVFSLSSSSSRVWRAEHSLTFLHFLAIECIAICRNKLVIFIHSCCEIDARIECGSFSIAVIKASAEQTFGKNSLHCNLKHFHRQSQKKTTKDYYATNGQSKCTRISIMTIASTLFRFDFDRLAKYLSGRKKKWKRIVMTTHSLPLPKFSLVYTFRARGFDSDQ